MNKEDCPLVRNKDKDVMDQFFKELYIHKPHLKETANYKNYHGRHSTNQKPHMVSFILSSC